MRRVSDVIDCWFDSGRHAVRPVGISAPGGLAEQFSDQFPADFISEAIDQTRGWFYSLLAISTLLFGEEGTAGEDGGGGQWSVVSGQWQCEAASDLQSQSIDQQSLSPLPSPLSPPLSPSLPQLHRAGPDAGRGRREDVEEQAELPRAGRNFRPLRRRRPAVVFLRQPAALDFDPLQRAGHQGLHSRVPAAAVERLQFLRDLRQHRRLRPGGARMRGAARASSPAQLGPEPGPSERLSARGRPWRVGPLDPQRTAPHGRGGESSGWTPTTISRPAAA